MKNHATCAPSGPLKTGLLILVVGLSFALCSCQRTPTTAGTTPGNEVNGGVVAVERPENITESNYLEMIRRLRAAPVTARGRDALRELLIGHIEQRFDEAITARNHDRAWETFTEALSLYQGSELERGRVARRLGPMAAALLEIFEPRGDESKVLVALLVLTLTDDEDPVGYANRYREVSRWSRDARGSLTTDTERVMGLVQVYEGVTAHTALQEPVDELSRLYLERHRLLQGAFSGPPDLAALLSPGGRAQMQRLLSARGQTVADIVTLYLRAGRPQDVRRAVSQLGNLMGNDRDLVQATRNLRSERRRAESLFFLAANMGRQRADVALQLCHEGFREFPEDARFGICLAEIYRHFEDVEGAFFYYESVLEADPSPENFEHALRYMTRQLQERLNVEDSRGARAAFTRAESVLESFIEHHPDLDPPIRQDQLTYLAGMGEYNAGNIDQAVERFEASNAVRPNRGSLIQLGLIAERRGRAEQAVRHFRAALDLRGSEGAGENPLRRAVVLTHLADSYELASNSERARTLYNEALEMLRVATSELPPEEAPEILIERGLILHKLGRADEGNADLRRALSSAPQRIASYGRLLSFYVGHGMLRESVEVFRLAFNHSQLPRMWKIYYSIWLTSLQRRLGEEPDQVATRFLEAVEGSDWIDRLGRFAAGQLPYNELISSAETQGQRAEAYFYEAVRQLAEGNRARADELLQQVIDTDMLGYFEYEFTLLIRAGNAGAPAAAPASSANATP